MSSESKICQNCKQGFVVEPEDFQFYKKINVPPPTLCPDCRYQRRLANRNERNFYKRKCLLCGKDIVSIYNPEYSGPVYCQPCWWGDGWDRFAYGRDFDFSRTFFDQFQELRLKVPHIALANWRSVNSEYTNQSNDNKNCYICVSTAYSENCLYSNWADKVRDSIDCYSVLQSELLYESFNCINCSRSAYLEDCADSTGSYFLKDCNGCVSCFGCYGLRNKSYCWKNEQLTKEEYQKRISEFIFSRANIEKERESLRELAKKYPHKNYHGRNTVNSIGDYIHDIKNAYTAFNSSEAENLRYCQDARYSQDSVDCTEVWCELGYELEGAGAKSCIAVTKGIEIFDSYYSELCSNSHDLFGCVGLIKKEYCIFNRIYEKTEYQQMIQKIIAHMKETKEWGEFFPANPSLFAYNETVAQDYFPLREDEAVAKGFRWYHRPERDYKLSVHPVDLPEIIQKTEDNILREVIGCASQENEDVKSKYSNCSTAFKITEMELQLYRKMNIPIPQKCSICRRQDRMALRNPRKLWKRKCQCFGKNSENGVYQNIGKHFHKLDSCPNEFETSYAPERPEIVYCEQCYQSEIA